MLEGMIEATTARAGRPVPFPSASRDAARSRKQVANNYMREGLRQLDQGDLIPFFCECDRPDCFAVVWLTRSAFDRARARNSDRVRLAAHRAIAA